MITDLRKSKVIIHNLCSVSTEIPICSEMSFTEIFLSAKMNAFTESTISGVLTILGVLDMFSSWILFQPLLNNLAHL